MPGGGTLGDHLRAAKRAGADPPELHIPPPPPELHWLLPAFERLTVRRDVGEAGQRPLKHSEIEAFCRLEGVRLRPWELEALEVLDRAWVLAVSRPADASEA